MSKVNSPKAAFEKDISSLIKAINELSDSIEANERRFGGLVSYADSLFKEQGISLPVSVTTIVDKFITANHQNLDRVKKFSSALEKYTSSCRLRETK